jgi:hypothetical protein
MQGIGGALLTPGSLAIIQATFSAEDALTGPPPPSQPSA